MNKIATTAERANALGSAPASTPLRALTGMLLIAVAGLLALVGFAGPASAASPSPYPPAPSCSVAGTSTGSGTNVTGTGFAANTEVSVSLGNSHSTVLTDASGSFATSLDTGSGRLVASGQGCSAVASIAALAENNPVPASNSSGGALPNTGADVLGVAAVAGLMVLGGVFLLVQGRRRHS
ncbi:MAG: LPXTG cell wall anchor domain-containing protein [Jatrophihabitantaceae bacterium]